MLSLTAGCLFAALTFTSSDTIIDPLSSFRWHTYREEIEKKQQKLQEDSAVAAKRLHDKNTNAKFRILRQRLSTLTACLDTLSILQHSTQEYRIKDTTGREGNTYYDGNGRIIFAIANVDNFVHETTHGGQFETGSTAYNRLTGKAIANDVFDEISAYKAQFAFDPGSVERLAPAIPIHSMEDMTVTWLLNLRNDTGYVYRNLVGLIAVDIHSRRDSLMAAYPWKAETFFNDNVKPEYTIKSNPEYIWREWQQ